MSKGFVTVPISISAYDLAQTVGVVYIVRDLAAHDPYQGRGVCQYCGESDAVSHNHNCLWARAKRVVDSGAVGESVAPAEASNATPLPKPGTH